MSPLRESLQTWLLATAPAFIVTSQSRDSKAQAFAFHDESSAKVCALFTGGQVWSNEFLTSYLAEEA